MHTPGKDDPVINLQYLLQVSCQWAKLHGLDPENKQMAVLVLIND
jgi:hypothetical protein